MSSLITLAVCALNQWALDFEGNLRRIKQSLELCRSRGAQYRLGPELEITGYGCNDHFYEPDTYLHAWEVLGDILRTHLTNDMLCDFGMPITHRNIHYNCRIIVCNGKILLIRPKRYLAIHGNYREFRWFAPWVHTRTTEEYVLPNFIRDITGQISVPIGDAVIATLETRIGCETCEELFTPDNPHISMGLSGIEIFSNGSASHHELGRLHTRVDLIKNATKRIGGIYLYSNLMGCDGERVYYDGCAMIAMNGELYAHTPQFSIQEVEVASATLDLEDVRSYRGASGSWVQQAAVTDFYPMVRLDMNLAKRLEPETFFTTSASHLPQTRIEEEIRLGPACWLWDHLRRSGASGFFLPLSGGSDSSSVAMIVYSMCQVIFETLNTTSDPNHPIRIQLESVIKEKGPPIIDLKFLMSRLLYTCYMGTENSSSETRLAAKNLALAIGSNHLDFNIDPIIQVSLALLRTVTGKSPVYRVHGGSETENKVLQNLQARLRMMVGYLFAQALPWLHGSTGYLLVLGTANVDECLRGYMTKYDCSSADINPIGGISKKDLRKFLAYVAEKHDLQILYTILRLIPSAELEPTTDTHRQTDESDMGLTYEELSVFGKLRNVAKCGPYGMFRKLSEQWKSHMSISQIADKVKHFWYFYAVNRHKATVLTPSYHAETYGTDDNRYDLRPYLYPSSWTWQFRKIDECVVANSHHTS